MDGLAQAWEGLHLWLLPPIPLVPKALMKIASSGGASGVLAVPKWPLASFWALLFPDGVHFANQVSNFIFFSPKYYSGGAVRSKMFRGIPHWESLAFFADSDVE